MLFKKNRKTEKLSALSKDELQRLSIQPRFKADETILFGHRFKLADAPTFLSSFEEIFNAEIYKFTPKVNTEIVIIDCGANIGLATFYFKRKFPKAKVIAYEADPNIFRLMKDNISSFGYTDVILNNEAVSDRDGEVNFHLEGGHSGMIMRDADQKSVVLIKSVRLKNILRSYGHISFLKIDIEGHETRVIPDIAEELKLVDCLFLEYHSFVDSEQDLDTILRVIKDAGMRYYLKEAYNKPFPFIDREIFLKMDFLTNIFCYRA